MKASPRVLNLSAVKPSEVAIAFPALGLLSDAADNLALALELVGAAAQANERLWLVVARGGLGCVGLDRRDPCSG